MVKLSGTEGYAEEAEALFGRYEGLSLTDVHGDSLRLVPAPPADLLEIGAGTGRDAAAFAALGHRIVALEPVDELRNRARVLHRSPRIEWIDDGLPELSVIRARGRVFDVALLTAVWFHLDEGQRSEAMPNVAALVRPGGSLLLSLRYGPVPPGRRMFEVTADETIALAAKEGLRMVINRTAPSVIPRPVPVIWTRLAFTRD
jgi:SAM-dependent methyltransferase